MAAAPQSIRALKQEGVLELSWGAAQTFRLPFKQLRELCPCAVCVDEFTGERILDPATVPVDILPTSLSFVGNYALKIAWSDQHSTGLYTWDFLDRITQGELST